MWYERVLCGFNGMVSVTSDYILLLVHLGCISTSLSTKYSSSGKCMSPGPRVNFQSNAVSYNMPACLAVPTATCHKKGQGKKPHFCKKKKPQAPAYLSTVGCGTPFLTRKQNTWRFCVPLPQVTSQALHSPVSHSPRASHVSPTPLLPSS